MQDRRRNVFRGRNCKVDFKMHRKGIAEIAMGPALLDSVIRLAETEAKPYAISISPRSDVDHIHYQDSFQVVPGTTVIAAMKRVAARLVNTAPHAAAVEWGTKSNGGRGLHVLGYTLDHLNGAAHHDN